MAGIGLTNKLVRVMSLIAFDLAMQQAKEETFKMKVLFMEVDLERHDIPKLTDKVNAVIAGIDTVQVHQSMSQNGKVVFISVWYHDPVPPSS